MPRITRDWSIWECWHIMIQDRFPSLGAGRRPRCKRCSSTHTTVREVIMLEIDEALLEVKREVLREWNNCSKRFLARNPDNVGQWENKKEDCYESCFDDDGV
ncbi:hypothetical protein ACHAWX_005095 [Stephanocyclus meneghinianus]